MASSAQMGSDRWTQDWVTAATAGCRLLHSASSTEAGGEAALRRPNQTLECTTGRSPARGPALLSPCLRHNHLRTLARELLPQKVSSTVSLTDVRQFRREHVEKEARSLLLQRAFACLSVCDERKGGTQPFFFLLCCSTAPASE